MNMRRRLVRVKAVARDCPFCQNNIKPNYIDVSSLQKYTSERGKILAKSRTGLCRKHQHDVTREIKRGRHLALIPYVERV